MKRLHVILVVLLCMCSLMANAQQEGLTHNSPGIPQLLTLEEFLPKWFEESEYNELGSHLIQVETDDSFTYFSRACATTQYLYKVLNTDLGKIGFGMLNTRQLKREYIRDIVPEKDKYRRPNMLCNSTPYLADFSYRYIDSLNSLEIKLHWKIYCGMLIKLVNKRYTALYNFEDRSFSPVNISEKDKK